MINLLSFDSLISSCSRWISVVIISLSSFLILVNISSEPNIKIKNGSSIAFIGGNLYSRMSEYASLETKIHARFPGHFLRIRNICNAVDTPGFRPRAGRRSPWAFKGAQKFYDELAIETGSNGIFNSTDGWLESLNTDVVFFFLEMIFTVRMILD